MDEYSYVEFEESYKKIYASLTKDKVLQLSDILSIPSQSINECYNVTNSKLWNTVKSALNHMRNRALLNWELSYKLVLKDEDSKNFF